MNDGTFRIIADFRFVEHQGAARRLLTMISDMEPPSDEPGIVSRPRGGLKHDGPRLLRLWVVSPRLELFLGRLGFVQSRRHDNATRDMEKWLPALTPAMRSGQAAQAAVAAYLPVEDVEEPAISPLILPGG